MKVLYIPLQMPTATKMLTQCKEYQSLLENGF